MTMTRTTCKTLAMRGTIIAASALAVALTACGTAQATHRHASEGAGTMRAAATVQPVGRCGDLCSVSAGQHFEGGVSTGVDILMQNYNDHPVSIRWQAWPNTLTKCDDGSGQNPGAPPCILDTVRVPAHGQRTGFVEWGAATSMWVEFMDFYNRRDLGGVHVVRS